MSTQIKFGVASCDGDTSDDPVLAGVVYLSIGSMRDEEFSSFSGWVQPDVAALVKAAPLMLETLEQVRECIPATDIVSLARINSAIAQATGATPINLPKIAEVLF